MPKAHPALPTSRQITNAVLAVLLNGECGKDERKPKRPKFLSVYQICNLLDPTIAQPIVDVYGVGGAGGGTNSSNTLTRHVMFACRRLANARLVRIRYMDTTGMTFDCKYTPTGEIRPSYPVCAIYQFSGPIAMLEAFDPESLDEKTLHELYDAPAETA